MIEIAIGFVGGIAVMTGVAGLGIHSLKKHPEIVAKYVGKKMAEQMRKQRQGKPPAREMIP